MTQDNLYAQVCSYENLESAYEKARERKSGKRYVIEFEKNLHNNLLQLREELLSHTYKPLLLKTFILRDPKTRKISRSEFRDRIVHHALCNIIEPIFNSTFIFDSYANRQGKGTHKAIQRFDQFKRKVSKNNTAPCFILKADIKHYFESVLQAHLLRIIQKKIKDEEILGLITTILANHQSTEGKGMPLGNLTSQIFANVYLNELDQFVKHKLRVKYYIRYVDDFVILDSSYKKLEDLKEKINQYLKAQLDLELHPEKSRIVNLKRGINFLGYRIFYHYKLIRKRNIHKFERKFYQLAKAYHEQEIPREHAVNSFQGWLAYIVHANTYKYRRHLTRQFNHFFPLDSPLEASNLKKHESFQRKIEETSFIFTTQKTLALFRQKYTLQQIAEIRGVKEATVWQHLAELIEYRQVSVWKVVAGKKVKRIYASIQSEKDTLKEIKERIQDENITYPEIACVFASVKASNKAQSVQRYFGWYKNVHCYRKCYFQKLQREKCSARMDFFYLQNPTLEMTKKEFLLFFNTYLKICILPEREKTAYIPWKVFQRNIKHNKIRPSEKTNQFAVLHNFIFDQPQN